MTRYVRYGSTVTVALLVVVVLFSRIAIAQDGTGTVGHCEGLAPGAGWICEGFFGILEWFVTTLQAIVRGMFEAVVEFILTTPAPYADGERALLGRPDNPPWPALYDLYLMRILPIGLALWALVVLLVQFTRLFTVNVADEYRRTRLTGRAAFAVLFLIAWWPVGAFTLHLADALTLTIAPTGEQMLSTVSEFQANVGGGILIAVLVYLSAGVVAFLLVMLFLARYVVIFTFMPMMPLVIALGIIDEGPFKPLAGVAKSVGNLFVPFVFMTLPSAAILLVGYTIQDALRESLGSISVLVAVSPGATSAYALILFVFWVLALLAPIFMIIGSRGVYPLAFLGAGFIAGKSLSMGQPRLGTGAGAGAGAGAAAAGRGSAVSSAASGAANGVSGGVAGARDGASALPPGTTDGLPDVSGGDPGGAGGGVGPESFTPGSGSGGIGDSGLSDQAVRARPTTWRELDEQLPNDRKYEFGFPQNGEFQPVNASPPNTTKSTILHGRIQQMADSNHFVGQSEMYLRDEEGDTYDLTPFMERFREEARFEQQARQVVVDARENPAADAYSDSTGGGRL